MKLAAAAWSDVGRKRRGNEDSFGLAPELGLFVLADGMGGHAAGEVASRLAVETVLGEMRKYLAGQPEDLVGARVAAVSPEGQLLLSSIRLANRVIYDAARARQEYAGMGTTLVSALARQDRYVLANVGDSRIYRIRGEEIVQLSHDHSLVQDQMDRGVPPAEAGNEFQYRHLITRALGLKDTVEADLDEQPALPGDRVLLCSDGLSDLLEDEEMLEIVQQHPDDLDRACRALVDRANYRGGDDNITALLIRVQS